MRPQAPGMSRALGLAPVQEPRYRLQPRGYPAAPRWPLLARRAPSPQVQEKEDPHPQWIDGTPYSAEYWGVTVTQFREFLEECKAEPPSAEFESDPKKEVPHEWSDRFTIGDVVKYYVNPTTKGGGVGLALRINAENPLRVSVMISHAWDEEAEEFCQTLERSVGDEEVLFICALALYQHDDGAGPSIKQQLGTIPEDGPFGRVLNVIQEDGEQAGIWKTRKIVEAAPVFFLKMSFTCLMLPIVLHGCVPYRKKCALGTCEPLFTGWLPIYTWSWEYVDLSPDAEWFAFGVWSFFLLAVLAKGLLMLLTWKKYIYRGRMIAVPNHNVKMYTRLWCVFEMFVARIYDIPVRLANTLAPLGDANSRGAKCTVPADQQMITEQIDQAKDNQHEDGHDMVDEAIVQIGRKAWWKGFWTEIAWGWPLALCQMCIVRLLKRGLVPYVVAQAPSSVKDRVKAVATHGRLGFDVFCQSVFESHTRPLWAVGLIVGVLAGFAVVIGFVVWLAKCQYGRTTSRNWWKCAAGFFASGCSLCVLGLPWRSLGGCQSHLIGLSWVCIGLMSVFFQGAIIVILFLSVGKVCRRVTAITGTITNWMLLALSITLLTMMVLASYEGMKKHDDVYATVVFYAALLFGGVLGPLAMFWTTALRWGIRVIDPVHGHDGDEGSGTDSSDLMTFGDKSKFHFRVG